MIKLIATDLDGTLLDGNRRVPEEIFPLVETLYRRGVLFAPASGRQYANLKKLFAPVADKVVFICENGALVKFRGETLYLNPIKESFLKTALDEIRLHPHLNPLLCGENSAYIDSDKEPFHGYSVAAYTSCTRVDRLEEVIGRERILKIAIFDDLSATENCIKVLPQKLPYLRTILSGKDWCDVSDPTADKGAAIRFIREKFGIKKEECVAFGDHMNDLEMLKECGTAYVTENAYPPLKALFENVVPSNDRGGVTQKIKEILSEEIL